MNLTSIHFNQENLTSIRWPYVNYAITMYPHGTYRAFLQGSLYIYNGIGVPNGFLQINLYKTNLLWIPQTFGTGIHNYSCQTTFNLWMENVFISEHFCKYLLRSGGEWGLSLQAITSRVGWSWITFDMISNNSKPSNFPLLAIRERVRSWSISYWLFIVQGENE